MSKIVSIATSLPKHKHAQSDICQFANTIYSNNEEEKRKLNFLYNHSGIDNRYSVVADYSSPVEERSFYEKTADLEPFPSLERRMQWYEKHALPLSVTAIDDCIKDKINSKEITHLITVSCTGFSAPGLDLEIMEAMDLQKDIFRTSVNFMGCYAAIHALKLADVLAKNDTAANIIIVCTELCTLHFQKHNSIDNITSTLLFGDGCAAVLVQHSASASKGIVIDHFYSEVAFRGKKDMSWQLSSTGFLMSLSGYVPELVKEDFGTLVQHALKEAKVKKEEIAYWCIHPGGKKILEAIQKSAGLEAKDMQHSYKVLQQYGNMSSPTVVFVLKEIMEEIESANKKNAIVFAAAFGPGLTMETFTGHYE